MKTYLNLNEVQQLESMATNLRDRLLLALLVHLKCRLSEVLALTVEDIDFTRGTLSLLSLKRCQHHLCIVCRQRLGPGQVYCPGCGHKIQIVIQQELELRQPRKLPLDAATLNQLQDYIHQGGSVAREGKLLLFNINRHRAWQIVRACAEKAGLPELMNPKTGKRQPVSPRKLQEARAKQVVTIRTGRRLK